MFREIGRRQTIVAENLSDNTAFYVLGKPPRESAEMLRYLHLKPGDAPPRLEAGPPFKAIVVVDDEVSDAWQELVSDWLVQSGCRYMLAWGRGCSSWDDSVDQAFLHMVDYEIVPDEALVMTTWHENESLEETFRFAAKSLNHPNLDLEDTYIVHIAPTSRAAEMMASYDAATARPF